MTLEDMLTRLDEIKAEIMRRLDAEKRAPENKRLRKLTRIVRSGKQEPK
jgi:hypothetical protein